MSKAEHIEVYIHRRKDESLDVGLDGTPPKRALAYSVNHDESHFVLIAAWFAGRWQSQITFNTISAKYEDAGKKEFLTWCKDWSFEDKKKDEEIQKLREKLNEVQSSKM